MTEPIMEIETDDPRCETGFPGRAAGDHAATMTEAGQYFADKWRGEPIVFLGFGAYLPDRIVTNEELVEGFPEITPNTSIKSPASGSVAGPRRTRSRRAWPIRQRSMRSPLGHRAKEIDAVIVATTTPTWPCPRPPPFCRIA